MGCGTSRLYTQEEIQRHLKDIQARLPSAELLDDQRIQLTKKHGFFNSSALLDSSWLNNHRWTNDGYREAIDHLNQRIAQSIVGTPKDLSIEQVPTSQATKLALQELNAKYEGRAQFTEDESGMKICITFK